MPSTYTLISSNVLSSNTASVTFSSIPSTYTDLVLRATVRTSNANWNDELQIVFNSDTGTNYSAISLDGVGSSTSSSGVSNNTSTRFTSINGNGSTSNIFSSTEIYIPSYLSTSSKPSGTFTGVENNSSTQNYLRAVAQLYRGSSAITSMQLTSYNGANFLTGSSFRLYGIKNS